VFLAAKIFCGAAAGWLGPAIMTYLSEIALPQFRGAILSCFALSLAIGQFTNAIACQIVNLNSPMEYKRVFYSEFVYLGIWGAACLYIPESPGKYLDGRSPGSLG
jgi:MFS family permease